MGGIFSSNKSTTTNVSNKYSVKLDRLKNFIQNMNIKNNNSNFDVAVYLPSTQDKSFTEIIKCIQIENKKLDPEFVKETNNKLLKLIEDYPDQFEYFLNNYSDIIDTEKENEYKGSAIANYCNINPNNCKKNDKKNINKNYNSKLSGCISDLVYLFTSINSSKTYDDLSKLDDISNKEIKSNVSNYLKYIQIYIKLQPPSKTINIVDYIVLLVENVLNSSMKKQKKQKNTKNTKEEEFNVLSGGSQIKNKAKATTTKTKAKKINQKCRK